MRKIIAFSVFVHVLAISSSAAAEQLLSAPGDVATDRAAKLYDEGVELYLAKRYAEAYAAYIAAWSLKRHYQIAGNLGDCEMQLGKYRDAAEHLTYYLREGPKDRAQDKLAPARVLLEEAKTHIGTLEIVVDTPGVDVFVDGKTIGQSPLPGPVFVDPGKRLIEAHRGLTPILQTVDVTAGGTYGVQLHLRRVEPPGAPVAQQQVRGAGALFGASLVSVVATGGLFAASNWASGRKGEEFDLSGPGKPVDDWRQTEDMLRYGGYASLAAAGGFGILGFVALWRGSAPRPVDAAFVPAPGGGRFQVKLHF